MSLLLHSPENLANVRVLLTPLEQAVRATFGYKWGKILVAYRLQLQILYLCTLLILQEFFRNFVPDSLKTVDAYAAIRIKDYRRFVFARFFLMLGTQMQAVIVGWQIYEITHDALSLGMIGLAEAVPFFVIALFAGHVADNVSRKKIIVSSNIVYFMCAFALFAVSAMLHPLLQTFGALPIYAIIFITGLARGFIFPAQNAFAAQLVPRELYGNAVTWNSIMWHIAAVVGPAIGGLTCGFYGISMAYSVVVVLSGLSIILFALVKKRDLPAKIKEETIWESLTSGVRFVFGNQIILSAISLDMFAVFFGGAVSILPIFADQVLHTGAKGLGFLRAAPAVGAIMMSVIQTHRPFFKKAGRSLITCVFGFGITIILFALSRNIYIAMAVLIINGMFDNVSVVIRGTIMQLYTPDEMRGRVSAVNSIFIGSSNELGSFESGVAAKLLGLIPSIIFGGTMTLAIVESIRRLAPNLKKLEL